MKGVGSGLLFRFFVSLCSFLCSSLCSCSKPLEHPLDPEIKSRPRGHQNAILQGDGSLKPHWIGTKNEIGLCLNVPVSIDTSQWQAGFRFSTLAREKMRYEIPSLQAGTTLCFGQIPPKDLSSSHSLEICGTLKDGLTERLYQIPCIRAVFEAETKDYRTHQDAIRSLIGKRTELPRERLIEEFDTYATILDTEDYPFQALRLRLILIDHLRNEGTEDSLAEVRRRLDSLPPWLEDPAATEMRVSTMLEEALFEQELGRRHREWALLERASEVAQQAAVSIYVSLVARQAEILESAGGSRESIDRLQYVLESCDRWACNEALIPPAHDVLAWLLLLDPDVSPRGLEQAEKSLRIGAEAEEVEQESSETANRRLNQALLALRRHHDPSHLLAEARRILERRSADSRRRFLLAWTDVLEGLAALQGGKAQEALDLCNSPATGSNVSVIAAWGWSCRGQAHRQLGDLPAAAMAFEQAILRHTLAAPDLGQDLPVSPGQRVDDYFRAARVAIERQDLEGAWQILETLDHLAIDADTACEDQEDWVRDRLGSQRLQLLKELALTAPPFAPARGHRLEPVRHSIMESLEEIQRAMLSDCLRPLSKAPNPADYRAFALPEELIILAHGREDNVHDTVKNNVKNSEKSSVTIVRRTPIQRSKVLKLTAHLVEAQSLGQLNDLSWRELARPLADALLPLHPESLGGVTRFALHGVLQEVPLSALPIGQDNHWLGDFTTPVLQPPLIEETETTEETDLHFGERGAKAPLFVVDPLRNLPSGGSARKAYRDRFPEARILFGSEATLSAVRQTLPEASFLHIDAHGQFKPTFPSLSGLSLADGPMSLTDFALFPLPESFVNLSGCNTASSPQTGNSGHYGLAGAVARRGVPWVVANRGAIADHLGHEFNEVFYREIAAGHEVPRAFAVAMAALRGRYPAAAWSNLLLLGSAKGGESRQVRTNKK